jgi:ATP-dependent helicase/nuclease subunit B
VQLAVYALLLNEHVTDAHISLDEKQKVVAVPVGETLPVLATDAGNRLLELFKDMVQGESLPANGAPAACRYCEMRGLCRLDYWESGE